MLKIKRLFVRSSSEAAIRYRDELHLRKLRKRNAGSPAVTRSDLQIRNLLDDPMLRRALLVRTDDHTNVKVDEVRTMRGHQLDVAAA